MIVQLVPFTRMHCLSCEFHSFCWTMYLPPATGAAAKGAQVVVAVAAVGAEPGAAAMVVRSVKTIRLSARICSAIQTKRASGPSWARSRCGAHPDRGRRSSAVSRCRRATPHPRRRSEREALGQVADLLPIVPRRSRRTGGGPDRDVRRRMLVPSARVARHEERDLGEPVAAKVVQVAALAAARPLILRPTLPEHEDVVRVPVGDAVPSDVVDLPRDARILQQVE